jgi:hypothetical protein
MKLRIEKDKKAKKKWRDKNEDKVKTTTKINIENRARMKCRNEKQ